MEKQTRREETIKDLKNKKDSEARKVTTTIFVLIIASVITLIISRIDTANASTNFSICIVVEILILIILIINVKKYRATSSKFSLKTKKMKREFIKRKSKEGNLKEVVSIKDPQIVNTLLSKGIEKIEVKTCIVDQWLVDIVLKNGCYISTQISGRNFINLLNDNEKQNLMDFIVSSIKIQDDDSESMKIQVETTIPNCSLYKEQPKQEDLLEMFEVKNSCYGRRPT